MNKSINNIKFTLTPNMSLELIKFNDLKNEYEALKKECENNNVNLLKLNALEKQMNECKSKFVSEFKKSNKEQINEYLHKKDY